MLEAGILKPMVALISRPVAALVVILRQSHSLQRMHDLAKDFVSRLSPESDKTVLISILRIDADNANETVSSWVVVSTAWRTTSCLRYVHAQLCTCEPR